MSRFTGIAIVALAAGAVLALLLGLEGGRGAQAAPRDLAPADEVRPEPFDGLTRAQLAGLYAGLSGVSYQPAGCVPGEEMFTDVPASNAFCRWIEELARRGITSGCTGTQYCPDDAVTRAQMALFVVKAMESCPTLDSTDEMIRVGGVCIDKYEASLWDAPVGGSQITGAIPCSANGQDCTNIYARSVAGVAPRASITWFQAQQALANSGKRLPSNADWQAAAAGTPGPGDCNIGPGGALEVTGANAGCVSTWGAYDMVGNLTEWVADWMPRSTTTCPGWGAFSDDGMCLSGALDTAGGPGALVRGGEYQFSTATSAGVFDVYGAHPPYNSQPVIGFRGAR